MANNKNNFFTVKQLDNIAKNGDYIILIGERANGKSYAVKSRCLMDAYESIEDNVCNKQLGYMRRYDLDNKDSLCTAYFADMPVQEITDGKYTLVTVFRKDIYFGHLDEKGKVCRDIIIGHTFSISASEHMKSLMYPNIYNIIFEEFITTGNYLYSEPIALQHAISSILRNRRGKIFMIGNTISRQCPYYTEWNLNCEHLKPNESNIILFDDDECNVNSKVVVHRCAVRGFNSGLFFGRANESITKGQYITEVYPHLAQNVKNYRTVYRCVLEYENFLYLLTFIYYTDVKDYVWYVEPKTTPIKPQTRIVTNNKNRAGRRVTSRFDGLNEKERQVFKILFDSTKVYFADNLTGTEFNRIISNFR